MHNKEKKIFLYAHGGSGNHGCEAIIRSTIAIMQHCEESYNLTLLSDNPGEDVTYGVDQLCRIIPEQQTYSRFTPSFVNAYLRFKLKNDYIPLDKLRYKKAFDCIGKNDVALSVGGDNYCYADVNKYIMLHDMLLQRGAKTVLWGCSVEPEIISRPDIAADLRRYQLITARESITYQALKKINPNTKFVADPAFLLWPAKTELRAEFKPNRMVGINISPMVMKNEIISDITMRNYGQLVDKILSTTDMGIVLIPHVVWKDNDDCIPLKNLYECFKKSGRVILIEDRSCTELKYVISQCRFFIGARTHATIAAYSSCVPTLVIGYSIKARGIARDLFQSEENYLLPIQEMKTDSDLWEKFQWLMENENSIRAQLKDEIPEIQRRALSAGTFISEMFK